MFCCEQVEADRWRHTAISPQHDEDAEPDQVEAGLLIMGSTTALVSTIMLIGSSAVPAPGNHGQLKISA
jgi:hypothetical protein